MATQQAVAFPRPGYELPNGAYVLDYHHVKLSDGQFDGWVILAIFPGHHHAFVTWRTPEHNPTATEMGHYHASLDDAIAEFANRCLQLL